MEPGVWKCGAESRSSREEGVALDSWILARAGYSGQGQLFTSDAGENSVLD